MGTRMKAFIAIASLCSGLILVSPVKAHADWEKTGNFDGEFIDIVQVGSVLVATLGDLFPGYDKPGKLYRSQDTGATWQQIQFSGGPTHFRCLAVMGDTLFAGNLGGVFLSTDQGNTWSEHSSGLRDSLSPEIPSVIRFLKVGNVLYAGSRNSVFRFGVKEDAWVRVGPRLLAGEVFSLAVHKGRLFAGLAGYKNVVRLSEDSLAWEEKAAGLGQPGSVICMIGTSTSLLVGIMTRQVFQSLDLGESWTKAFPIVAPHTVFSFAGSGNHVYAGTHGGAYRSLDGGATWDRFNTGENSSGLTFSTLFIAGGNPDSGGYLIGGTQGMGIWRRSLSDSAVATHVRPSVKSRTPERRNRRSVVGFRVRNGSDESGEMINAQGRPIGKVK